MKNKKRTTAQEKIVNPDRAMAYLVEKPRKVIQKGITRPPPPIPQTVEMELIPMRSVKPINSIPRIGKTSLCWQRPEEGVLPEK